MKILRFVQTYALICAVLTYHNVLTKLVILKPSSSKCFLNHLTFFDRYQEEDKIKNIRKILNNKQKDRPQVGIKILPSKILQW